MKEFWNTMQMIFAAVGGWLGYFLGGCDGLLKRRRPGYAHIEIMCTAIIAVSAVNPDKHIIDVPSERVWNLL